MPQQFVFEQWYDIGFRIQVEEMLNKHHYNGGKNEKDWKIGIFSLRC